MIVESIDKLKKLSVDGGDFYIRLNGGLRSSKMITYLPESNTFEIYNEIDDTFQSINESDIFNRDITNIGHALENNALYKYIHENT